MQTIEVLLVEDDLSFALEVEMLIAELGYSFLGTKASSDDALIAIKALKPDLLILDININGSKNGIQVAQEVAALGIPLIFITASNDQLFFEEAKTVSPAAYLVKPFHMRNLQNAIELAVMKSQVPEEENPEKWHDNISPEGAVFVKMNKVLHKIHVKDIFWIEVSGNYSYLHSVERKYIMKMSLKTILKNIHLHVGFIRVHKQFVVQIKCIESVNVVGSTLSIKGTTIPIGRKYKKELMEKIEYL